MTGITSNKDVDFLILLQLSDVDLKNVCQVDKYLNNLCNNETFWYNRFKYRYKYGDEKMKEFAKKKKGLLFKK